MTKRRIPPKPKLARLIRFVGLGVLPAGVAAQYDEANNLVRIDKELFDTLNVHEQSELLFARSDVVYHA